MEREKREHCFVTSALGFPQLDDIGSQHDPHLRITGGHHETLLTVSFNEFCSGPRDHNAWKGKVHYSADWRLLYKGLGHTVLGPTGVNLCMLLYLTSIWMCSCIVVKKLKSPFIVRHGNVLTMVIMHHFGLECIRDAHLCVNRSTAAACTVLTITTMTVKLRQVQKDSLGRQLIISDLFSSFFSNAKFFQLSIIIYLNSSALVMAKVRFKFRLAASDQWKWLFIIHNINFSSTILTVTSYNFINLLSK